MGYENTRCEDCGLDQHPDCFRQCRCGVDYCFDRDKSVHSCFRDQKAKYGLVEPDYMPSEAYDDPDQLWRCDACNPHRRDREKQNARVATLEEIADEMKGRRGAATVERALKVVQKHADRLAAKATQAEQKDVERRRKMIEKRKREEQKEQEKKDKKEKKAAERAAKRQKREEEEEEEVALVQQQQ
jgi:hypothetical protein